jgi:hypothetical protein
VVGVQNRKSLLDNGWELFRPSFRNSKQEDVMRACLANLTTKARILLAVPLIAIAYIIVTIVVPAVVHAAVPEVVRSVLSLI